VHRFRERGMREYGAHQLFFRGLRTRGNQQHRTAPAA
jgi:hypothetical protein